jgi:NTP pyrophosphatase (non-canonical NTP hydrolase)
MTSEITLIEPTSLEGNPSDLRDTLDMVTEECAEVIQAISKVKRFGLDDGWGSTQSSRQQLETEVGDLLCLISILVDNKVLDRDAIEVARFKKSLKIQWWAPNVANYFKGKM